MKKPFRYFLLLLLVWSMHAFAFDMKDFEKHFKLVPQPQKVQLLTGKGISYTSLQSILLDGVIDKPVLYGALQYLPLTGKGGPGVLTMTISGKASLPGSPESYKITIKDNAVAVVARTDAGLFYACQTLSQLLQDARDQQINIPACSITDYPDIAYRAVHLDLKHHVDAGHYYYNMIDRLAAIKINAIIVEFEDKLRFRKASVVGSGNAITIDEFAAISRYARERHIEISPLVQGLGHASFILKHNAYKALRDTAASDWSFDPMNPETYALQFSLYEDAIAATPFGKYLHVGGDEVGNLGMSELSKRSGLSPIQLQMQWLTKVSEFARAHGRIPIFWDDMVFKLSGLYRTTYDANIPSDEVSKTWQQNAHRLDENVGLFPKECVYMRWNYDTPDIPGNHKAIDWYKSHDLSVMAATAAQTMWPMLPRDRSNFQPIKEFCRITSEKKLDGILCTAWDDCSPHFETYWRGFYDFAFFSWHYKDATVDDVHSMFRHRFYAPALVDTSMEFQDLLEQALVFWETALIEKGHRNNFPSTITLVQLPDQRSSGVWNEKYKEKIKHAREEIARYLLINSRIKKARQLSRRNEFSLALMGQINELQVYPARLLALLEQYDKASSPAAKHAEAQKIKEYVNGFAVIRKNYEDVCSKTRLLSVPDDYILDQNQHHHLANGTKSTDWMYVYELAMNKEIDTWLAGQ